MAEPADVFEQQTHGMSRIIELEQLPDPKCRYIVAMTPRSGSSYLCNVIEGTGLLGAPGEFLNEQFIPKIVKAIPGRTADEYFRNVSRVKKTRNGVHGLKASWFQFNNFIRLLHDDGCLSSYQYIYLTRRDLAAQAVSLYKATASNVFHTNVTLDAAAVHKLKTLEYDFEQIHQWYLHIVLQEKGWLNFFFNHRISPCYVTYEEVDEDVASVVNRIALYVGVNPDKITLPETPSVFSKVSDSRNMEWACRYMCERNKREGF